MWKLIEKNMHNDLRQNMVSCSGNDLIKKKTYPLCGAHTQVQYMVLSKDKRTYPDKNMIHPDLQRREKEIWRDRKKTTNPALTILSPKLVTMTGVALGCAKATWYILEMVSFILEFSNAGGLSRWLGSF